MPDVQPSVDLRSDTVTRPSPAMRQAMADAEVGDDVFGDDPTVQALEARSAALFGKEAALFVPSGTMANLIAVVAQTRPGDTIVLDEKAHIYRYESGGCALAAGVMTRTLATPDGVLNPQAVERVIVRSSDSHFSNTALIGIENTMNAGGGAVYPLETVDALGQITREHGLILHCDGARIFNAVVATGISAAQYTAPCDSVAFCLSKGLGCPVGSLLVGSRDLIARAHRYRKLFGGGMRQAGVIAAAGLYALEHHIDRLAEDHRRAYAFRQALEDAPGLNFPLDTPTNMVFIDVPAAAAFAEDLRALGVWCLAVKPERIRAVFHLDVDDTGLDRAVDAFRRVARQRAA